MSGEPRDVESWLRYQERINPELIDLGLERVRAVASRMALGRPRSPVVLVGGTNGKGSVVAYLEALALAHGLRPGCYLSPWLVRYGETVRVAGEPVDDGALIGAFRAVEQAREEVALTAFEFRTLAAAHALRAAGVDLELLEVGLGGRLDAVNVFEPAVSVITTIGLDHEQWLGSGLERIAAEKAGIARAGVPLVCGDAECGRLVAAAPGARGARMVVGGRDFRARLEGGTWRFQGLGLDLEGLPLPALAGAHQLDNAAAAIAAFVAGAVAEPQPRQIASAVAGARLPGRLQRLEGVPERYVDVAHNGQAAEALARWLRERAADRRLHAVCACYTDKDAGAVLRPLADLVSRWYLAGLPGPRGGDAGRLDAALADRVAPARRRLFTTVESAWTAAVHDAGSSGRVVAFGSFETVRRILRLESVPGGLDT